MKKIVLYSLGVLSFFFVACSDRKAASSGDETKAFQLDSVAVHGTQRMQVSNVEQKVNLNGENYIVYIRRAPADSLPKVKSDAGDVYLDNTITLRITHEKGKKVFSKIFTKQSFSHLIGADFLSKSVLEGMVFDKVASQGFVFAASVSFPQTDLYVPVSLVISREGKLTIAKEELMDETYITEE